MISLSVVKFCSFKWVIVGFLTHFLKPKIINWFRLYWVHAELALACVEYKLNELILSISQTSFHLHSVYARPYSAYIQHNLNSAHAQFKRKDRNSFSSGEINFFYKIIIFEHNLLEKLINRKPQPKKLSCVCTVYL